MRIPIGPDLVCRQLAAHQSVAYVSRLQWALIPISGKVRRRIFPLTIFPPMGNASRSSVSTLRYDGDRRKGIPRCLRPRMRFTRGFRALDW